MDPGRQLKCVPKRRNNHLANALDGFSVASASAMIDPRLHRIVAAQPYPLLFATISGAHLYGFPSPDSDFDLRGAHVLPLEEVVGLDVRDETVEQQMRVPPHPGPLPIGRG